MHSFLDNAGRTWTLCIHVTAVKRLRALVGVDLYGLVDDKFSGLAKFLGDPVTLFDALYVLCHEQAEKLGISSEDFGSAMGGDSIEHASNAFLEELADFFPDARTREALKKVLQTSRRVRDLMIDQAIQSVEDLDLESIVRSLSTSSGRSPESSAPIQARLHSAS